MAYTILDILEKLVVIEEYAYEIYTRIEEATKAEAPRISLVAKTIAKQEQKHIDGYKGLIKNLDGKLEETIDSYLYDKVAKVLLEFNKHIEFPKVSNFKDLIKFALELEKSTVGLLLSIQGKLLEKMDDVHNAVYKIISIIIKEEKKHEKMFLDLLEYVE